MLNISWINDYSYEREYLLLAHKIDIERWILSLDYDQCYHYYYSTLTQKTIIKGPSDDPLYEYQFTIPKNLTKLKQLVKAVKINKNSNNTKKVKIKQDVDFGYDVKGLDKQQKIVPLIWMFEFAQNYKYGHKKPSNIFTH